MATLNLGRIKPVFKGAYSGSTAYVIDDIVTHGNESFICIQAHGAGTQATSVAAYWTKLAAKGGDVTQLTTQGDIVYRDGSGVARLPAGTAGQALLSGGAGANVSWGTVDLEGIKSDITALAIREATNEASIAFNLPSSFIDTFTDDTNLGTQTTVDRDVAGGGFVSSVYNGFGAQALIPQATGTAIGNMVGNGGLAAAFDSDNSQTAAESANISSQTNTTNAYVGKDFGAGVNKFLTGFKAWSSSNDGISSSGTNTSGCSLILKANTTNDFDSATTLGSSTGLNFRTMSTEFSKLDITRGSGWRYAWLQARNATTTSCDNFFAEVEFYADALTPSDNATGTLIQSANAVTGSRTKVGGTMTYKDAAGTNTIGTDLKIYFTCNGGSNWTEAASYTAITPVYSSGIKYVRLGETTCTGGTDVRYKAVWANQASTSKEAQLHAIGINY